MMGYVHGIIITAIVTTTVRSPTMTNSPMESQASLVIIMGTSCTSPFLLDFDTLYPVCCSAYGGTWA